MPDMTFPAPIYVVPEEAAEEDVALDMEQIYSHGLEPGEATPSYLPDTLPRAAAAPAAAAPAAAGQIGGGRPAGASPAPARAPARATRAGS